MVYDHGRRTTLGEIADQLIKGEGGEPPSALAPVALASLSLQWYANQDGTGTAQQLAVMEGLDAQGRYIDVGPANTSVRAGLWAWQSHTGLDGLAIVQPHWVLDGNGALLTGNAYWTRFRPDDHWYDWANLKADLEIAGTAVAGALMSFVQPETAALWLVALSDLADAWFAVSAAWYSRPAQVNSRHIWRYCFD